MSVARLIIIAGAALAADAAPAWASTSLNGSHASMVHQHAVALQLDYSFVKTPSQVAALVSDSALEPVTSSRDLVLSGVSYPYARPEVVRFVDWLAAAYRDATRSPLVVTSLTRPISLQPGNASPLSVHPAGMAVDLRIPANAEHLAWLEHMLLSLEDSGVVDVTREHHPPHLHVAVFPEAFQAFMARQDSIAAARAAATRAAAARRELAAEIADLPGGESVGLQFVLPVLLAVAVIGAGAATIRWAV